MCAQVGAGASWPNDPGHPPPRELFRALVEQSDEAMAVSGVTDSEHTEIVYVNDAFCKLTGWSRDELMGQRISVLHGPFTDPGHAERVRESLSRNEVSREEVTFHRRDGSAFVCVTSMGLLLVPGQGPAVFGIFRDVTEKAVEEGDRRRLQQLYEERQAWWEALLEQGSEIILLLDDQGIIKYASPSLSSVVGIDPDELVGTNAFDLVHPNDLADVLQDFHDRLNSGGPRFLTRFRARAADGTWLHLGAYATDVSDAPGEGALVVNARDISLEVEAEELLRRSEQRFRAMVQHSSDLIVLVDRSGGVRYASPAVSRVLGFTELGLADPQAVAELIHPDDVHAALALLRSTLEEPGPSRPMEVRMRAADGQWRVIELVGQDLTADPAVGAVVFNGRDVTDRRRTAQLLVRQTAALEGVAGGKPLEATLVDIAAMVEEQLPDAWVAVARRGADGLLEVDSARSVPQDVVVRMVGADPASELVQAVRGLEPLVFADIANDPLWADLGPGLLAHGRRACWSWPIPTPDHDAQVGLLTVFVSSPRAPSEYETDVCARAVHIATIAIEHQRVERLLQHQALHDTLTGLPNRTLLLDRIDQALQRGRRGTADVAVLFVDLDQFKVINDSMGHAAGDELLADVAHRFADALSPGDTVGRFGGDEFVVVAEDVGGDLGAVDLAERLLKVLADPFQIGLDDVVVTASVGIAHTDRPDDDPAALVRNADAAMYRAKELGRGSHVVFEQGMHDRVVQRLRLEVDLRQAIDQQAFQLHFQPIVRLDDLTVVGAEALLRWERPGHGMVLPGDFIPTAEETGLILRIGHWVLGEVCRQLGQWSTDPHLRDLRMSANLSARQLADPDLTTVLTAALAEHGVDPSRLTLEVTESVLVDDVDAASRVLARLHEMGVGVAIDDFGTGYASLDYVRRFTVADELKVDRAFVMDLERGSPADEAIVSASIVLARALGMRVVAEGVETETQLAALRRLGCDLAQGFLFARAVERDRLLDLVVSGVSGA